MDKNARVSLELYRGMLILHAETDCGKEPNISEVRTMAQWEVEKLRTSPADFLVEMFKDDQTRELARAFVREMRRFCR